RRVEYAGSVVRLLNAEQADNVLAERGDQTLLELVRALDETEISGILDRMQPADAAQVIEELPEEQREKVPDLMKEQQSEDVQELLEYGEKTAGRIMSPDVLAIHEYATVAQAIEHVRKAPGGEAARARPLPRG